MLASRAASIAARNRGLAAGSGTPARAAVMISRMSLVKSLPRLASCLPLRCMMFLNWECPAISLSEEGKACCDDDHRRLRSPQKAATLPLRDQTGNIYQIWCKVIGLNDVR